MEKDSMTVKKIIIAFIAVALVLSLMLLINDIYNMVSASFYTQLKSIIPTRQLATLNQLKGVLFIGLGLSLLSIVESRTHSNETWLKNSDRLTHLTLKCLAPASLATVTSLMFISWAPHYLFWPMWMDNEHFSLSAHFWDSGIRPYRDTYDFNFPGPIYFFWTIGKCFGWDNPMMVNLMDVAVLLSLITLLIIWSQKNFKTLVPGLFSSALIFRYYMSLNFGLVMQRDWHVFFLGASSLIVTQTLHSRLKWIIAGALLAMAFTIRPHAVLFLPAVIASVFTESADSINKRNNLVSLIISGLTGLLIAWSPLLISGIFDDFLAQLLQELFHGHYTDHKKPPLYRILGDELNRNVAFTALTCLAFIVLNARQHQNAVKTWPPWAVAFISLLYYKPLSPVMHDYTEIPFELLSCCVLGLFLGLSISENQLNAKKMRFLLVATLIWIRFYFPGWPVMANFNASLMAAGSLAHGTQLHFSPPGCMDSLPDPGKRLGKFRWADYQDLLRYIREQTSSETRVVNFILYDPFPTLNAPTGRLTLWPCGEGVLWLSWVDPSLEQEFANRLKGDEPTIVILRDEIEGWPPRNRFPKIERTIRQRFEFRTRFGDFQVWARKPGVPQSAAQQDQTGEEKTHGSTVQKSPGN